LEEELFNNFSFFFARSKDTMDLCLKEIIHNFTTNELLFYLDNLNLQLDQEDLEILKRSKISGPNFLHLTREDLLRINLELGPAITLSVFISKINAGKFCLIIFLFFVNNLFFFNI